MIIKLSIGLKEFKISMPDERPAIISEILAASIRSQVVVFCNNYKTAEKVYEKIHKTQKRSSFIKNAFDNELIKKVCC